MKEHGTVPHHDEDGIKIKGEEASISKEEKKNTDDMIPNKKEPSVEEVEPSDNVQKNTTDTDQHIY